MAPLTWDDSYSVGVSTLDNQHSVLFNLINELDAALMSGTSAKVISINGSSTGGNSTGGNSTGGNARRITGTVLRKLLIYTRGHFSAEEAMMASAKFPGLEQHRQTHRQLTKHVEECEARFERGEGAVNTQLLGFLREWVTDHVRQSDKEYGPWINKTGIR